MNLMPEIWSGKERCTGKYVLPCALVGKTGQVGAPKRQVAERGFSLPARSLVLPGGVTEIWTDRSSNRSAAHVVVWLPYALSLKFDCNWTSHSFYWKLELVLVFLWAREAELATAKNFSKRLRSHQRFANSTGLFSVLTLFFNLFCLLILERRPQPYVMAIHHAKPSIISLPPSLSL